MIGQMLAPPIISSSAQRKSGVQLGVIQPFVPFQHGAQQSELGVMLRCQLANFG